MKLLGATRLLKTKAFRPCEPRVIQPYILKDKASTDDLADIDDFRCQICFLSTETTADLLISVHATLADSWPASLRAPSLQIKPEQQAHFYCYTLSSPQARSTPSRRNLFLRFALPEASQDGFELYFVDPRGKAYLLVTGHKRPNWQLVENPLYRAKISLEQPGVTRSEIQPLLIGGAPKSGTHWVQYVLNAHPDIFVSGEQAFDRISYPGRDKWATFAREKSLFARSRVVSQAWLTDSFIHLGICSVAKTLLDTAGHLAGTKIAADRTPGNAFLMPHLLPLWPELRYIHCLRHPLDVAVSRFWHEVNILRRHPTQTYLKNHQIDRLRPYIFDNPNPGPQTIFADTFLLEFFIDEWISANAWLPTLPSELRRRVHVVRYQDMHDDFHTAVGAMLDFLGQPKDPALLDAMKSATSFERLSGGRQLGTENRNDLFRKGVSGDWRNYFTPDQLATARRLLANSGVEHYFEIPGS